MPKVNLITLGCPKNTVDSERMHRLLELNGYEVSDEAEGADVIVVNTCGFIEPAKEESIATVMDAAEYKEKGSCKGVIVTGCLAERYRKELEADLAEADMVVGLAGEREIVAHCDQLLGTSRIQTIRDVESRHLLTPKHWAYLRISDGCDRTCSFCAIPSFRGGNASDDLDRLVADAYRMAGNGVREIALIAQDTMRYGADLYGKFRLVDLLKELVRIDGLDWVRMLYAYPTGWRDDLIDLLATEEKLCAYVDLPIQHASDPILKAMNRGTTQAGIRKLVKRLRGQIPNLTIRSSVITGFPGERDADFNELMDFVDEIQFNRLVGFTYSHEEGTKAGELEDDVPEDVKRERLNELMAVQAQISGELNAKHVGQTFKVLVDEVADDGMHDYVGRTRMDAPEIDGAVFFTGSAQVGDFVEVEITDATEYDLIGHVAKIESLLSIAPVEGRK
ncbi:MAG: 30S ribosomal protein S12 methylthiotransferase RimO [Candidatus Latescibacteria bacterium]|jgi:ribosomal protein S12 methylthiotransferase|nr:30S ribosomal protein S12 methylthiotransferase RimO [Candidatus Latescibacterota bacterium]